MLKTLLYAGALAAGLAGAANHAHADPMTELCTDGLRPSIEYSDIPRHEIQRYQTDRLVGLTGRVLSLDQNTQGYSRSLEAEIHGPNAGTTSCVAQLKITYNKEIWEVTAVNGPEAGRPDSLTIRIRDGEGGVKEMYAFQGLNKPTVAYIGAGINPAGVEIIYDSTMPPESIPPVVDERDPYLLAMTKGQLVLWLVEGRLQFLEEYLDNSAVSHKSY